MSTDLISATIRARRDRARLVDRIVGAPFRRARRLPAAALRAD